MAIKKSDLYSSLWACCDKLRGGMDANRSFAIAHGLENLCPADPPKADGKRGRKKAIEGSL